MTRPASGPAKRRDPERLAIWRAFFIGRWWEQGWDKRSKPHGCSGRKIGRGPLSRADSESSYELENDRTAGNRPGAGRHRRQGGQGHDGQGPPGRREDDQGGGGEGGFVAG